MAGVGVDGERSLRVEATLPEELRPVYRDMVNDYRFALLKRGKHPFVSFDVIADLVTIGWRMTK